MTSPSPPPGEEIAAAKTLTDEALRRAALAIASSGGLLQRDIPKQLQPEDQNRSEEIVQALRDLGVVDSDLVVICSRGSTQVARVPDQEALERAATAGMRCACGRAILDETAEEALEISSLGRRLLDGSWWMSVLLMERLRELGIDYDSMLLEQKSGGDELDCFADLSGELALSELKDKEFSLGNAYSFGAKIGIHRPQHAVVVTTSHVGNDAKEHFRRSQDAEIDPRLTRRSRPRSSNTSRGSTRLIENSVDSSTRYPARTRRVFCEACCLSRQWTLGVLLRHSRRNSKRRRRRPPLSRHTLPPTPQLPPSSQSRLRRRTKGPQRVDRLRLRVGLLRHRSRSGLFVVAEVTK